MKKIFLALLLLCSNAFGALTDIKFGKYQIADSQWNVSACLNTTTCQIYSKNPGTMYKIPWTAGTWNWQAGQYVQFATTGNGSYPYEGKVYNSNGTQAGTIGTGKIVNMGPDYFFFVGNDNNTGQLFSGSSGMSNTSGVSWTGTLNPTIQQADTYANASYSTVPLSSGQTATSTPSNAAPPPPTYGTNFTRVTSYEWKTYTAGSQPIGSEQAHEAFDNNNGSKWFGLRSQGAWAVVQFVTDGTYSPTRAVQKIQFVTANDASNRDPTGFRVWGSINGTDWVLVSHQAISLPTGRLTASTVYSLSNVTAYSYYKIEFTGSRDGGDAFQVAEIRLLYDVDDPQGTQAGGGVYVAPAWPSTSDISIAQTAQRNSAKSRVSNIVLGNSLHLEQKIGSSNNSVTIEQTGNYNKIAGIGGGTYAVVDGDNNIVNIKQGDTLGKNLIEFNIVGNTNNVTIWQARNPTTGLQDGGESGGHYIGLNVNGSTNTLSLKQSNTGGATSGHFAYVDVTGNNNQGTLTQSNNSEKTFFGIVNGNYNVFNVTQQGGINYFDLSLTGYGHNVTANQKDSGSHKATINLTNAGGASTVNLVQQGATAQNINITQQCATLSGCSVSVTQGGGP